MARRYNTYYIGKRIEADGRFPLFGFDLGGKVPKLVHEAGRYGVVAVPGWQYYAGPWEPPHYFPSRVWLVMLVEDGTRVARLRSKEAGRNWKRVRAYYARLADRLAACDTSDLRWPERKQEKDAAYYLAEWERSRTLRNTERLIWVQRFPDYAQRYADWARDHKQLRDPQKQMLYNAENLTDFGPEGKRELTMDEAQELLDFWQEQPWFIERYTEVEGVTVGFDERVGAKGDTVAVSRKSDRRITSAFPTIEAWLLLHELAHQAIPAGVYRAHGQQYATDYLIMTYMAFGEAAADDLEECFRLYEVKHQQGWKAIAEELQRKVEK